MLVPILNEEAHLERSVRAMLAQELERPFEVLLIDGGSDDGTPAIIERLAGEDERVRLISNPERRTPNALNIGLRNARGEFVVRMDAHTYYPPDYIALALARFERGGVDCVCGPAVPYGEGKWSRRIALALRTRLGSGAGMFHDPGGEIEVDTSFTGVWRRSTLLEVGGWHEGWPVNQDSELCARIREGGGRYVQIPEMAARLVPRDSLRKFARQYGRYGFYRAKTARHHPTGLRRSHLLPPAVVLTFAAAVAGRGRPGWLARRAALLYAGALAAGTAEAAQGGEAEAADLASLPLIFAIMHGCWGTGFLYGCLRFGLPLRTLAAIARGSAHPS